MTRTPEQTELAEITRALLSKHADSEASRRAVATDLAYDAEVWSLLCEQIGVAALVVPEEYDGVGATLVESQVVLEELGYALAPAPLLATTLAVAALRLWGTEAQRTKWLPRVAAGEVVTVAWPDLAGGLVLDGPSASGIFAVGEAELTLVDQPCVVAPTMDQLLRLGSLCGMDESAPAQSQVQVLTAIARSLIAGLQVGIAQRGLDMTVAYAKQRHQFGRPIGSFQAIKHRLADCLVLVESARSAAWSAAQVAADVLDGGVPQSALVRPAAVASSYCSEALSAVAAETIQLHGGIAITWEHDAHVIFKAAHSLGQLAGAPHVVRAALA